MSGAFGFDGVRRARRIAAGCARIACLLLLGATIATLGGCDSTRHELALAASAKNAELTEARNDEQDAFVLSVDARERASLDRELDLISQLGEAHIEAKFAAELFAATELVASAGGAESRPMVAASDVAGLVARQNADRAATRAAINAKRKEITERLDAELKRWLADPKKRQQERIAAALKVYATENSAFARFVEQTAGDVGLTGVLK